MNDFIIELEYNKSRNAISQEQVNVTLERFKGATYNYLITKYKLSGNVSLERILLRTVQLKYWTNTLNGGSDPYLNGSDLWKFENIIIQNLILKFK